MAPLISKSYARDPAGSQAGDISGDKAAGEYTAGTYDRPHRRAAGTVDGHGWADRQGRIRRPRQLRDGHHLRHRGESGRRYGLGGTRWGRDKFRYRVEIMAQRFPTEDVRPIWMYAVGGVLGCTLSVDLEVGNTRVSFGSGLGDQETVCIHILSMLRGLGLSSGDGTGEG